MLQKRKRNHWRKSLETSCFSSEKRKIWKKEADTRSWKSKYRIERTRTKRWRFSHYSSRKSSFFTSNDLRDLQLAINPILWAYSLSHLNKMTLTLTGHASIFSSCYFGTKSEPQVIKVLISTQFTCRQINDCINANYYTFDFIWFWFLNQNKK